MPIGKDSIKRAAGITEEVKSEGGAEVKSAVIPAPQVKAPVKKAPAKKTAAKKSAKKSVKKAPVKKAAPAAVPAAKKTSSGLTVDQATGINAHYDINNPLPVFLL